MHVARATIAALALMLMTGGALGAQSLSPLVTGWEQFFRVESQSVTRDGRAAVSGTVWNTAPWSTRRIQLLVEALDGDGRVVNQRVAWLGVDLTAGTHASFEVPMPVAASYRVSVFAFDSARGAAGN